MNHYWVKLCKKSGQVLERGCVTAPEIGGAVDVCRHVFDGCSIHSIEVLPYPAEPRWNKVLVEFGYGEKEACPSFCYNPEGCRGHTSCPKQPSCVE